MELKNIEILGFKSGKELYTIVANSKCVVLPSEWYENGPYSAIEALKLGRPLIGSDLGGIPELIDEGENGYIFKNANILNLKNIINQVEDLDLLQQENMSKKSKEKFKLVYAGKKHLELLLDIYNNVLLRKNRLT